MTDTIITVDRLSKRYLVGHRSVRGQGYVTLRDAVGREVRNFARKAVDFARGRQIVQGDSIEEFWALKDINFEVKRGEVVGIIGRNGAGKSTLLKILSRITEPTEGRVRLRGRISALLEVGTGFHAELSGRENIYLNGAILGMTRREIKKKFDEMVAFAEVERFLDTPVKHYSSGMYVRLAFAVAAHLEPETLVVDEVLSVGDQEFQKKCLGKMKAVSAEGRTVLFVSHNMLAVRNFCTRGIVLKSGQRLFDGGILEAVDVYTSSAVNSVGSKWLRPPTEEILDVGFETLSVSLVGEQPWLRLRCQMQVRCLKSSRPSIVCVTVRDQLFAVIMQATPNDNPFIPGEPGTYDVEVEIALPPLIPGVYYLDFWMGAYYSTTSDYIMSALSFEVTQSPSNERMYPYSPEHGSIVPLSKVLSCCPRQDSLHSEAV